MNRVREGAALLFGLLIVVATGCGSDEPFDYIKVQGKLTYEDGTPIPASGMKLMFVAQDVEPLPGGLVPRPATAGVDAEGNIVNVTSHKPGDGLVPGKHKVSIGYATGPDGKPLIPPAYADISQTPLLVETGDGNIEIKVPKP